MKVNMRTVLLALLAACSQLAPASSAITCGQVDASLSPCVGYLTGMQPMPTAQCCDGVRRLRDLAASSEDRQTACRCMKAAASHLNVRDQSATALPEMCGTPVPFPISRNVDDCTQL